MERIRSRNAIPQGGIGSAAYAKRHRQARTVYAEKLQQTRTAYAKKLQTAK